MQQIFPSYSDWVYVYVAKIYTFLLNFIAMKIMNEITLNLILPLKLYHFNYENICCQGHIVVHTGNAFYLMLDVDCCIYMGENICN